MTTLMHPQRIEAESIDIYEDNRDTGGFILIDRALMDLLNPAAGFLVGVLVGFTGVGGGALMTPLLVLMFGVAPHTAIGTDLLFAAITKAFGGWVHGARGSIDWQVLRRLSLGSLPAAALTLIFIHNFPPDRGLQAFLLRGLGVALVLTSIAMLLQPRLHLLAKDLRTSTPERFKRSQPALTVAAGALLGFLVTLTSVGAGALGVVMLVYLYPFRLTPQKLVGTDIAHAIPLTLVAGLGHLSLGNVDLRLLGGLLLGSIPGIVLGSRMSLTAHQGLVRIAIALVLAVVGGRLLLAP
jgi:uncharacterized membrane protein YfcA